MRSSLIFGAACVVLFGACSHKTGREHVRGRFRCVQHSIPDWQNYGSNVRWEVFFDGKKLALDSQTSVCAESPDPNVELLVLSRHAVRVEAGKPAFSKLAGNPDYALWACAGRCLVYGGSSPSGIDHLDTGAFEAWPKLRAQPIALSPDLHTVVTSSRTFATARETTLTFCVMDLDANTATEWTVPRGAFPSLERCPGTIGLDELSDCLQRRGAGFAWTRGATGRDALVPPAASPETKSRVAEWGCTKEEPPRPSREP